MHECTGNSKHSLPLLLLLLLLLLLFLLSLLLLLRANNQALRASSRLSVISFLLQTTTRTYARVQAGSPVGTGTSRGRGALPRTARSA